MIDHHSALIYTMVLVSAADRDMSDKELEAIGEIVSHWPIFRDYDRESLTSAAENCATLLSSDEGLERTLAAISTAIPENLHETTYALACEVAAADGRASQEELRLLEILRERLHLGRLEAAAIEHVTRARHMTL